MSYKQNNPLSRKSSPLNGKGDKCPDSGCVQEAGDGKWKVISGQTGKDWPSTFPSRESAEKAIQRYHAGGFSRQPYGGNKGDEKKSVRDYEGPSRKSSSPLNSSWGDGDFDPYGDSDPFDTSDGQRNPGTFITSHPDYDPTPQDKSRHYPEGISRKSSSPLNNTGMTGLNYSKELRYNAVDDITQGKGEADYGFSRESSSPLDYGSWAHRDAERAKEKYAEGDYAWGRALGIDEHDADYAKHWHKDEAEHGTSRRSSSPLNKHDEWQKKIDDAKAKDGDDPDFYEKYAHLYKAQEEARLAHKK